MVTKFKLHVADFDILSDARTLEILNNGATATSNFKVVKDGNADVLLTGFPTITPGDLPKVQTQQFETKCATGLFEALEPVRKLNPNLLSDPKFWAWVSLVPMRDMFWEGGVVALGCLARFYLPIFPQVTFSQKEVTSRATPDQVLVVCTLQPRRVI